MDALLTPEDLADYLRLPIATIYHWRSGGHGPPAYRVGRHVRFALDDVEAWLRERRDTTRQDKSTAESLSDE
jgi:excisionase family DNA binding protein